MTSAEAGQPFGKIIVKVDPDLADLIPGFLANRRKDVDSLRQAVAAGDFQAIQRLGHQMKGAGGGYGFDKITEVGSAIEQAAKARDAEGILRRVAELSSYLERLEVVYG